MAGISDFTSNFNGELTTETMLIRGVNDNAEEVGNIADFIGEIKTNKSYISIPTRPPAEKWVKPASEEKITMSYEIFKNMSIEVEYLIGYEGNAFAFTGNVEDDLLSITSVHPMREDGIQEFLIRSKEDWNIIERLILEEKLIEVEYNNMKFYIRKFPDQCKNINTSRK